MILTVVLAVAIGLSLGLLGGGGSILTLPILVYVAGLDPRDGIATSLLVVGSTSLAAMLMHARKGRVAWRVGALFGVASMVGAFVGARVAHYLPSRGLLAAFTVMMVVTALAMMRKRAEPTPSDETSPRTNAGAGALRAALVGISIGVLTGLVGAGGGFVIVPALVFFAGMPMRLAVGTSLLVIAMNSFAGFWGTVAHANVPWKLALVVTAASVVGGLIGAAWADRVKPAALRSFFAWFVLAMATFMVVKQWPTRLDASASTQWAVALVVAAALGGVAIVARRTRRPVTVAQSSKREERL